MTLTQEIKREALRLGFPLAGVTTPDPPPHFDAYSRWLEAGFHGEMAYLTSERGRACRADPRRLMPESRSIMVLGYPYRSATTAERPPSDPQEVCTGRVAVYAWGADYHVILPQRLRLLEDFITSRAGREVKFRHYTDSGPILERDLAQRAGLGWIGKNTCLIHPAHGSFFFLAEILMDIELDFDLPFTTDHCGSCTRCLEACPTGCLAPGYMLDARRCLSYLTIELKGSIPPDLRPRLGNWVFGCDMCQQACPWNKKALRDNSESTAPTFELEVNISSPNLLEELFLTPQDFAGKFKNSPVKRTKRHGYLRNVAVALGNVAAGSRDPLAIQALIRALEQEPEALVRLHAAWALARAGSPMSLRALSNRKSVETDPRVLAEITQACLALSQG